MTDGPEKRAGRTLFAIRCRTHRDRTMTASLRDADRATGYRPSPVAESDRIPRVLLATDLGPSSKAATDAAIELARSLRGSLLVLSVVESGRPMPFGARVDQVRERRENGVRAVAARARSSGVASAFLVWQGEPGPAVVAAAEAEGADFIVLGAPEAGRVSRLLLGSVSDFVLRTAPCPVVIVRPTDDEADGQV